MSTPLRIATRRSRLALVQARIVADALAPTPTELVEIVTAGDRGEAIGDKTRWIEALEQALRDGDADLAVHSAKDVPGELGAGLEIVAATARADVRDALVGADALDALPAGARVGTSSLRRAAQVRAARDDLHVVSVRGNVETRLRKLDDGACDALLLAAAGLDRLGLAERASARLDPEAFVPAPGQGILAIEARAGDAAIAERLAGVGDPAASACLLAERTLCRVLGASCHTPLGAHATLAGDQLRLHAFVGLPDGSAWLRDAATGPAADPAALGTTVAERLLAAGARELLEQAESQPLPGDGSAA